MNKRNLLQIAVLVFAVILMGFSAWAVPGTINYQGKLTDPNGVSMDGYYIMKFYFYNAESDGNQLWNEQQDVAVTNGVYNVELGKIASFPPDLFDNENLYLEVKVFSTSTGWETLSPRQRLTSTPFAMKAGYASTAGDADTLDGLHTLDLFNTGDDYGRFGVASDLYEGTNTLTDRYVNEAQAGSITNGMIVNDAVTSNKIADGAVGTSDLSGNAVTSAKIQDGTIQQSDLSFGVPDGHSLDAADGTPMDAVYVDDSGNVGIGTRSPDDILDIEAANPILRLTGPTRAYRIGNGSGLFWIRDETELATRFTITSNGKVGIGTTSPENKLEINGALQVTGTTSPPSGNGVTMSYESSGYNGQSYCLIQSWNNKPLYLNGTNNVILASKSDNVGIGTTEPGHKLDVGSSGNYHGIYSRGYLQIGADGSGDRFMVDSPGIAGGKFIVKDNGNIGIGTTNPQGKLDVTGGILANFLLIRDPSTGHPFWENWIGMTDNIGDGKKWLHIGGIKDSDEIRRSTYWADRHYFQGNVGIGTTSPAAKLDVAGNAAILGNIGIGTTNPETKLDVEGTVQARAFDTGDIVFRKDGEKLWRMYEDEKGLYLESLKTGETSRIFLEKDIETLRAVNKALEERLAKIEALLNIGQ